LLGPGAGSQTRTFLAARNSIYQTYIRHSISLYDQLVLTANFTSQAPSLCDALLCGVSHLCKQTYKDCCLTPYSVPDFSLTRYPSSKLHPHFQVTSSFPSLDHLQSKMTAHTIAIIGGGPCGLTLARLLECKGIDYVVYERDESENSNRAGGSLDLHPETGQHALREGGLFDDFKKYARYDDTVVAIADKLGKRVLQIGQGRDAPEIDRRDLRQILLDAVPKEKIKWGHALTSVTAGEDNKPILHFSNGVVLSGIKLVVGADGAWSKVRPMV
jgi:FAD binding domain